MSANYAFLDWLVFASYGAILLLSGWWFNRKRANSSQDFFLGGNSMPTWMVAISVLFKVVVRAAGLLVRAAGL